MLIDLVKHWPYSAHGNFFTYPFCIVNGYLIQCFLNRPWISGGMICLCMLFIYGAVRENVKMGQFEIFWYAHHFFVLYFILLLTHGNGGFGKNFWKWFVGPGALYLVERILRSRRARQDAVLLSAIYMKPNVFSLEFAKEGVFKDGYSEGQYLFICCPKLSWFQWHPFTISSAPQENKVTIHIRVQGPGSWTRDLCEYITAMGPKDASFFEFYRMGPNGRIPGKIEGPDGETLFQIDGPHSAPTQHVGEYETVMIIGGGIGVTPVSSTLKSILYHRWKISQGTCYPSAAYFYWVVAYDDIDAFRWLLRYLKDAADEVAHNTARDPAGMAGKRFEFHIWVTSAPAVKPGAPHVLDEIDDADDYGFWGAPPVDTLVQKTEAPFTALDLYASMKRPPAHVAHGPVHIYSGRPKWGPAFAAVSKAHPKGDIGVAFCGNPIIAADLSTNCYLYSKDRTNGIFKLHKENF
jgi:NAD(P)H-flavin reductase